MLEQVKIFNYLGFDISCHYYNATDNKLTEFMNTCGTVRRTIRNKTRKDTGMTFNTAETFPIVMYDTESWTVSRRS